MAQLPVSSAIGTINSQGILTLNWQPAPINGSWSAYENWNIWITTNSGSPQLQYIGGNLPTGLETGGTPDSRSFTTTLGNGEFVLDMQALAANGSGYTNSSQFDLPHTFPQSINPLLVSLNKANATYELNEPVLITMDGSYNGAAMWRILYQDGTQTGWLPMAIKSIVATFTQPGEQVFTIQVQNDYSLNSPPVQLRREFTVSAYIVDMDFLNIEGADHSITGDLGLGGNAGFEIATNSASTQANGAFAVVVRTLARDTVTGELKMLIATSRGTNASSLYGTMAVDVFPIIGRPRVKDLLEFPILLQTDSSSNTIPVHISTTTLPALYVGQPMTPFQMSLGPGTGTAPFMWYARNLPKGLKLNTDGTLIGTPMEMGTFQLDFVVVDSSSPTFVDAITLPVVIGSNLAITSNTTLPAATVGVNYLNSNGSTIQLSASGGLPPYQWKVVSGALPVGIAVQPNGTVTGYPCSYNSVKDFVTPFVAQIQVSDAIGAVTSLPFTASLSAAPLQIGNLDQTSVYVNQKFRLLAPIYGGKAPYSLSNVSLPGISPYTATLIDGNVELEIGPLTAVQQGTRTLSFTVTDSSSTPQTASAGLVFNVSGPSASPFFGFGESTFDHVWTKTDTNNVSLNISGSLGGLTQETQDNAISLANGLHFSLSSTQATIAGPATIGGNAETHATISIAANGAEVGFVSRDFTVFSHDGSTEIGNTVMTMKPYIVGTIFGVNPLKPYYNPGSFTKASLGTADYQVFVSPGSSLPKGLSLDSSTGLIYGKLLAADVPSSTIIYTRNGATLGIAQLNWTLLSGSFNITGVLGRGQLQLPYLQSLNAPLALQNVTLVRGSLPNGLVIGVDSNNPSQITISGSPLESGYFDIWLKATAVNGLIGYYSTRFQITYTTPLVILTSSLPVACTSQPYSYQLAAFGGLPQTSGSPYTWSLASGSLLNGITLNGTTGLLSGTTTDPDGTSQSITIQVTDGRNVSVTAHFTFAVNNTLTVTNTILPIAVISQPYSAQLVARGGTRPYTAWSEAVVSGHALPTGLSFNSSTGLLSGVPGSGNSPTYDEFLNFTVTDSANVTSGITQLELKIGAGTGMTVDTSGVGHVPRGAQYLGVLKTGGTFLGTAPYTWSVLASSTNPLPTGLSLDPDTGIISGSTTVKFTNLPVTFGVVDVNGNSAAIILNMTSYSTLAVSSTALASGIVNGAYSYTVQRSGGVPPVASWAASGLPSGYNINPTTGQIYGTYTGAAASFNVTITVTDSIADSASATLPLLLQNTNMVINSPSTLPAWLAGTANSSQLGTTGNVGAVSWSLDPSSEGLPTGITLSSSGLLAGTSTAVTGVDSNGSTQITVPATAVPWEFGGGKNAAFAFPLAGFTTAPDNGGTPPVVALSVTAGQIIAVSAIGSVDIGAGGGPNGPQGIAGSGTTVDSSGNKFPTNFMVTPLIYWGGLCGAFTDSQGNVIEPVAFGTYAAFVVPTGATQLQLGVNDTNFADNTGSFIVTVGYPPSVTVRATDSTGAYVTRTYSLIVNSNLKLLTGPDYINNTTNGYLGYISHGDVTNEAQRPNLSFYVVATGVVATDPSLVTVTASTKFGLPITPSIVSLNNGVAQIALSGNFYAGSTTASNDLTITMIDTGVVAVQTFKWNVYSSLPISLAPDTGTFPFYVVG